MKATEIRDKIFKCNKILHEISTALNREIDWNGIDVVYLDDKIEGEIINISRYIKGQLKFLKNDKWRTNRKIYK